MRHGRAAGAASAAAAAAAAATAAAAAAAAVAAAAAKPGASAAALLVDRKIAELNDDTSRAGRAPTCGRRASWYTWDERDDFDAPWTVLHGSRFDANSHKISASVVWAAFAGQLRKHIFFRRAPGWLRAQPVPQPVQLRVRGRREHQQQHLLRQAGLRFGWAPPHWCDYSTPGWKGHCSTHPNDLDHILKDMEPNDRAGCNELIFEQVVFERNLPHSVEAIWYDPKQSPSHGAERGPPEVLRAIRAEARPAALRAPWRGGHEPLFLS